MRLTAKRIFSLLGATVGTILLLLNIHVHNSNLLLSYKLQDFNWSNVNLQGRISNTTLKYDTEFKKTPKTSEKRKPLPTKSVDGRPWYMRKGKLRPESCDIDPATGERDAILYPEEGSGDRIVNQLMFVPPADQLPDQESVDTPLKKILLWNGGSAWGGTKPGRGIFIKKQCPVSTCVISTTRKDSSSADLIIYKDHFVMPGFSRPANQLWMMYMLESPLHTQRFKQPSVFNWTATYRSDSTVVTPYERWEYYDPNVRSRVQERNYAANKTKKVAWFVSNCAAKNNRLKYARELSKHIDVDIFGTCGKKTCPRKDEGCFKLLDSTYKFYLSFENSNCRDYITEKFYVNGLGHNVLPIVMGARPEDYARSTPQKSYIHVDEFESAAALAQYLHRLDNNDDLYNEYFAWKGTGEMIDTKFFCRLCALLHDKKDRGKDGFYEDLNQWWRSKTCINGSWRDLKKSSKSFSNSA